MSQGFSHSSNTVKLFKHLDRLKLLQEKTVVPIMIHAMPTHKCQMNCYYCCFKNREDKTLDMPFEHFNIGVTQFRNLGTKAIELTGGGDPTLYPRINDVFTLLKDLDYHIGVNTNAVDSQLIRHWDYCDWVRISMNTLDTDKKLNVDPIRDSGAYLSACYIWHSKSTMEIFKRVADFCKQEKIVCRIAPDCIQSLKDIESHIVFLKSVLTLYSDNEYLFLSDFNISTTRHNHKCYIHMIKPAFYTDGYIYPCPSSELACENGSKMQHSFAVCRYDEVYSYYKSDRAFNIKDIACSYCKYEKQNTIIEEVLTRTEFNEFA